MDASAASTPDSPARRAESSIRKRKRRSPPICRPSKIVCIGVNYRDHAADSGAAIPTEPIIFFKATSSIVGPDDPLVIPRNSRKVDWEVELAVVIGARATYVAREQASGHV